MLRSKCGISRPSGPPQTGLSRLGLGCINRPICANFSLQPRLRVVVACLGQDGNANMEFKEPGALAEAETGIAPSSSSGRVSTPWALREAAREAAHAERRRIELVELSQRFGSDDTVIVSEDGDPAKLAQLLVRKYLLKGRRARLVVSDVASNMAALAALVEAHNVMRTQQLPKGVCFQPHMQIAMVREGLGSNFRAQPAFLFVETFELEAYQDQLSVAAAAAIAPAASPSAGEERETEGTRTTWRVGRSTAPGALAKNVSGNITSGKGACVSVVGKEAALTAMKGLIQARLRVSAPPATLGATKPMDFFVVPEVRQSVYIKSNRSQADSGRDATTAAAPSWDAAIAGLTADSSSVSATEAADAPKNIDVTLLHVLGCELVARASFESTTPDAERAGSSSSISRRPREQRGGDTKAVRAQAVRTAAAAPVIAAGVAPEDQMISVPLREWVAMQAQLDIMTRQHSELLALLTGRIK